MLALDKTIGFIEASESDVVALYRSAPTASSRADQQEEGREAYVCAIRRSGQVQVYVALVSENGKIVVYTAAGEPEREDGYRQTLQEALAFARSLGFAPERVSLEYSAAIREVVVRNVKFLRPPGTASLLQEATADAPTPAVPQRAPSAPAPRGPSSSRVLNQEELLERALWELFGSAGGEPAQEGERSWAGQPAHAEPGETLRPEGEESALEQPAVRRHSLEMAGLQGEITLLAGRLDEANRQRRRLGQQNDELAKELALAREELARLAAERELAQRESGRATRENCSLGAETEALESRLAEAVGPGGSGSRAAGAEPGNEAAPAETATFGNDAAGMAGAGEPFQWPELSEFSAAAPAGPQPRSGVPAARAGFPLLGDPQDDFFPVHRLCDWEPGLFLLQAAVTAIQYGSPDEVMELYQSVNVVYLSPEGKGQENCQGYVCCLRDGEGIRVMAALFGTQSGRTRVYLPELQPQDDAACAQAVSGAIAFAEQVGFLMESLRARHTPSRYRELVARCPVLKGSRHD